MIKVEGFLQKSKKMTQRLKIWGRCLYEHVFLAFLVLAAAIFIIAGIIFYKYAISGGGSNQDVKDEGMQKIDRDLYQKAVSHLDVKKKIFEGEAATDQSLLDPFR